MYFLFTGGSACGKSTYAEHLAVSLPGPHYYLAAMQPLGVENQARIVRHREQRKHLGFETIERYTDIGGVELPARGTVMLECVCNLTANEMFDDQGARHNVTQAILGGIAELETKCENLLVVTNDVGSDGADYDQPVLDYIQSIGDINNALAKRADHVYELCCGFPEVLKGELMIEKNTSKGPNGPILIIGAMASGKREYVTQTLGYAEAAIADGLLDDRPVLLNLQSLVRQNLGEYMGLLPELLQKEVVVCNETGSGVIPASREDTAWRESTGRLCNALAEEASQVIRLVCGLPTTLKG